MEVLQPMLQLQVAHIGTENNLLGLGVIKS